MKCGRASLPTVTAGSCEPGEEVEAPRELLAAGDTESAGNLGYRTGDLQGVRQGVQSHGHVNY